MPNDPIKTIKHILVSKRAREKEPKRVEAILGKFPKITPVDIENEDSNTVREKIHELEPETRWDMSEAVTRGKKILVLTAPTAELVRRFKTDKSMICPHFHIVTTMSNGCVFSCEYCYLQATYRAMWPCMKVNVNFDKILKKLFSISLTNNNANLSTHFNMGELMDALAFEPIIGAVSFFLEHLDDKSFANSELVLLTKSNEVTALCSGIKRFPAAAERIVPAWSLNTPQAATSYEHGSASIDQRLQAAKEAQDAGYRIRLRIDPMIPYGADESYLEEYEKLVHDIFDRGLNPEVITLGSLRYENAVIPIAKRRFPNTDLFDLPLVRTGNDKNRLPFDIRLQMYKTVIAAIREHNNKQPIGLCKEREQLWLRTGLRSGSRTHFDCNCRRNWTFEHIQTEMAIPTEPAGLPVPEVQTILVSQLLDDESFADRRPDSYEGLKRSVSAHGMRHPIEVLKKKVLNTRSSTGFAAFSPPRPCA